MVASACIHDRLIGAGRGERSAHVVLGKAVNLPHQYVAHLLQVQVQIALRIHIATLEVRVGRET
jgi:hypothetical protein